MVQAADKVDRQVLVVDDDPQIGRLVDRVLTRQGYRVQVTTTAAAGLTAIANGFRGVVVLDVQLPDMPGTELFERFRAEAPELPVIFLTGYGSTDLALDSLQQGAFEFLDKSAVLDRLAPSVAAAFETLQVDEQAQSLQHEGHADLAFASIITQSRPMRAVFQALRNAIDSKLTVLIRGESGTGKELIARAIHQGSPRRSEAFVPVNSAGIPESLLESEMFGYERGAFTGANNRKIGHFEAARRGTLFLDEIGELHTTLQAKLLRAIQEGQITRVGGSEPISVDVRLVAATHRDLEQEVEQGRFREDLYYRLAVFTVYLPALRERPGDIPLLAEHFVARAAERENRPIQGIDPRALEVLTSYSYPGNVRELENLISYAVVASRGPNLTLADLPRHFLQAVSLERKQKGLRPAGAAATTSPDASAPPPAAPASSPAAPAYRLDTFPTLAAIERSHILAALDLAQGNKTKAAQLLGISRMTLYRKTADLGLAET